MVIIGQIIDQAVFSMNSQKKGGRRAPQTNYYIIKLWVGGSKYSPKKEKRSRHKIGRTPKYHEKYKNIFIKREKTRQLKTFKKYQKRSHTTDLPQICG